MSFGWTDLVGAVGVIILMVTFLMLQLGRLESSRVLYSALNAVGASLIAFSLLFNFNLSAFVIEVFWILISLVGIFRVLKSRTRATHELE